MTSILGLATGLPENRYHQKDICEKFLELQKTEKRRDQAVRTIFNRAGVEYRHMVVDPYYFDQNRTTKERNDKYMEEAIPLSDATIRKVLETANCTSQDIDDFIVVSCTGFAIPGLDLHLAGRLGMRSNLRRTCILGMGCYGAFPALVRAVEATALREGRLALVLCVELCSLHLQFDGSAENVVSSALFSDGAAAVLVGTKTDILSPRIIHSQTQCDYQTLDQMSFNVTDSGFRMYLSSYVPDLLAQNITGFVDSLLAEYHLTRDDIRFWGIHPGSQKIVEHVQYQLGISDQQAQFSYDVLYRYGNMSSVTILFILEQIIKCTRQKRGDKGVLLAFGPGLTMEGLLLEWV
jgi:predicted naringenin-chalcone synthase